MKHCLNIRMIMLTFMLLVGALPAAAVQRPFALNGNGLADFISDGAGHVIGANVTSSGTATHLGLWTSVGTLYLAPDPNNSTQLLAAGTGTITAADGDKIEFVLENSVLDVTTSISRGIFRFVGGTGRFAAATGTTDFVVVQNLVTGAFQLTAVGNIDF